MDLNLLGKGNAETFLCVSNEVLKAFKSSESSCDAMKFSEALGLNLGIFTK